MPRTIRDDRGVLVEARVEGARIVEKIISGALAHFPGVYLITPFLQYEITTELAKFARSL